jgi:hypothetical protein
MNNDVLFPQWEAHAYYNFGTPDDQEWLVDKIMSHKWDKNDLLLQVHWNLGNSTWEPLEACKDLQALNDYLSLIGVSDYSDLPH